MPDSEPLAERLAALRSRYPDADPQMVAGVVRAVLSTMTGDLTARDTALLADVEDLGRTIASAKAEIAALKVDDITASHIPSATDELDAIVEHTAAATNAILETCETLDSVAAGLDGETATKLQDATAAIYEACSFQDITGQRISKIVGTLKKIDAKVANMLKAFVPGDGTAPAPAAEARVVSVEDPASLLNGPQLPATAMDQADIDQLLASFD
jgi:chemotaxis protein CheZ